MKKEPMSIGRQIFLGKIVVGCAWIGSGVTGMFDALAFNILHLICLLSAVVVMVILLRVDLEEDDEMSKYNYTVANATTAKVMYIILGICSVLCALGMGLLRDVEITWYRVVPQIFFLLMGIQNIITGAIFRKLEAE